jgi:hypothetical protein
MANYVFAYSGGKGVAGDEAERNAQMARWGQWFGELGSAVVDGGAAMGTASARTSRPEPDPVLLVIDVLVFGAATRSAELLASDHAPGAVGT